MFWANTFCFTLLLLYLPVNTLPSHIYCNKCIKPAIIPPHPFIFNRLFHTGFSHLQRKSLIQLPTNSQLVISMLLASISWATVKSCWVICSVWPWIFFSLFMFFIKYLCFRLLDGKPALPWQLAGVWMAKNCLIGIELRANDIIKNIQLFFCITARSFGATECLKS